ncbi:hypothetical protein Bbelb_167700 [Branchiostoma belcheri]|nr:hypothetical protein Bbelb_167700 [Branchiostoma belcheri]
MGSLLTSLFVLTLLSAAVGTTVDYTGHNLTQVPTDAIMSLAHTVRLSHNRISRLGSGFTSAPRIRYLFIDDNRVNNLSPQTFQPLRKLFFLDLDRNCVVSLRDFTFSALAALSDLILSNNLISAVSARAFHGLTSLQFLELSGNRLSAVPAQAVRLIPSERLLLVLLMVNNISQIPGDIASLHPSASYSLQGNPLRCPAEKLNSSRVDVINVENMSSWPPTRSYVVDTPLEGGRRFVGKYFLIKDRHEHFGVAPKTFYVPEHLSIRLPEVKASRYVDYPTAWITPTGRRTVPAGEALTIEDFTAEDSGLYRTRLYVRDVPGIARHVSTDDICAGSQANQSCSCFNGSRSPSFHHQEFKCDAGSTNSDSEANPTLLQLILGIASVVVVMMLLPVAVFRWRKGGRSRYRENGGTTGAALCAGAQAMAVCIPLHPLPGLTELSTEGEPSASPLAHLRRGTGLWAAMKMGGMQYSFHRAAGAPPADTIGTTEAQVHHYENADADEYASAAPPPLPGDGETAADAVNTSVPEEASPLVRLRGTEFWGAMKMGATQYSFHRVAGAPPADTIGTTEAQVHHYENADDDEYASAAPPPLPGDGETAADAVNTSVPDGLSEQPAFQIGEGLEMPYGVAAANTLYRQRGGTAQNPSASFLTNEHTSSADVADSATYGAADDNPVDAQTVTTDLYRQQTAHILVAAEANTPLYRRDTAPNRRSLTSTEHTYRAYSPQIVT